jgi:cystathionine gamma-lyase
MAAATTLALALLKSGDHVVASDDLYGGTRRLFDKVLAEKFGIGITYADATDAANVGAALTPATRLVWLETPTNPLLKIYDIRAISEIAHASGSLVAVDSTFASPYLQQPLSLGADISLHSTTKYINGHSDSVGGAIMLSNGQLHEKLRFMQNAAGAILSPFDSYLTLRGIKTLALRMEKHSQNAQMIAEFLQEHPRVQRVIYPGLPSHPQHQLAKRQMKGFGGMVSFEIKGGKTAAHSFLSRLRIFALAESLGGVESLIEHPATMTHASVPPEKLAKLGITGSLIRLSAGIERADDLIVDLEQALSPA